jgi:serine/threonine-protein kinase
MSPEQLKASRDVDARSDIWSLGVVLYEMLTRSVPFYRESMGALVVAVMHEPHPVVRIVRNDLPAGFEAVIDRCLEKDPARRYADIAELARALAPFGPPRSAESVERIEHVLGYAHHAPVQTAVMLGASNPGLDARTLSPTSAAPTSTTGRRLLIPSVVVLAAAALVAVYALGARRGMAPPAQSAAAGKPQEAPATSVAPVSVAPSATIVPAPSSSSSPASTPAAVEAPRPSSTVAPQHPTVSPGAPRTPPGTKARGCKVVSFFDDEGNKHFKQECP